MNFSMYSIRIFDLEMRSRTLEIWVEMSVPPFFFNMHMCAKISASRLSHLFPVTFHDGSIYVHNASSHSTIKLCRNGVENRPTSLFDMQVLSG